MDNFRIFDLSDANNWNLCLKKLPINQQDIYYTPEYYQLYEDNGDGKAFCFVYEKDENIALYPFLKNSVNELGFDFDKKYYDIQGAYGYNGIVSSSYNDVFISGFYSQFEKYISRNDIIAEFTRFHPVIQNHLFPLNMSVIKDRKTVFLDINKEYDFIWENCYSSINRNMIRKALKNNISITKSNMDSDYSAFFDIYKKTMHNLGAEKYLYFSEKYINNIKLLLPKNHKLIIAKKDGKIITAMILMLYGKYAHYHLSGRLKEYSNIGANNLILDEAIKIAQKEGCIMFHFGGGRTSMEDDSLLKFKSNFSKVKFPFYIGKRIHNDIIYREVIKKWENKFPYKINKYNPLILKYRY